jgi:citrate synthase
LSAVVTPNRLNPLRRTGKDELLETAMALHDAAIKDEYFVKRKLAPNVDFWYVLLPPSSFKAAYNLS